MSELENLTQIILAILNNDNKTRMEGELLLKKIREENFSQYVYVFTSLLAASPDSKVRLFCVAHIRRLLSNYVDTTEDSQWDMLTNETHKFVKQALLEVLVKEEHGPTRRLLCELVGELSATIRKLDDDTKKEIGEEGRQWDDLMPNIWTMLNSNNTVLMECSLKILGILFVYCGKEFASHKNEIFPILRQTLEHPEMKVKAGAIEAISSFITTIQTKHCKVFADLIPGMLQAITMIAANNEDLAVDVLNDINDMVAAEPKIFKPNFKEFIDTLRQVSLMNVTLDSIKANALEIVVLTFEMLPTAAKANTQVLKDFFEACFAYMVTSVEDIDKEWLNPPQGFVENDDDGNTSDSVTRYGMHLIDRVVSKFGAEISLPLFSDIIYQMVQSDNWRYKYAAVMGLSQVGEYITKLDELDNVVAFTLKFFKDEHPKVRYAACHCVGQIAEDSKPQFQTRYKEKVIPAFIEIFGDNVPRVIAHALAGLTNFLDGCEKRSVTVYIPQVLDPCLNFLSHPLSLLKENAMSVIATLAEASQKDFIPYWEKTAQIIFEILKNSSDKEYKQTRGQAIECLVLIGEAVGKEEFKKGAAEIINKLIEIQNNSVDEIDPQKIYLLNGWQRICNTLKEDLQPYLEHILPSLFNLIDSIIFIYKERQKKKTKASETDDVISALKGGSDKPNILHAANTSESQEIVGAVKMISVFVVELKKSFAPYVEKTSEVLTLLLEKSNNVNVKLSCARGLPGLIQVIQLSGHPNKDEIIRTFAKNYVKLLWKANDSEIDPENKIVYIMVMRDVMRNSGAFMTEQEIQQLQNTVLAALKESDETKISNQELLQDAENEIDAEEEESIKNENALEEELHCALAELIGAIFETHKNFSLPLAKVVFQNILPNVLVANMSPKMYKFGLFLVDNIIEFLGMEFLSPAEWSYLGEIVIKFSLHKRSEVRQPAVFGVGLLAEKTKDSFQNISELCVKALLGALQIDRGIDSAVSYGIARDNAIASIGKIMKYQSQFVNIKELTQIWFKLLPCRYDKKEAREQHDMLMDIIIESEASLILGERGENLAKVIKLFALLVGTKFVFDNFEMKMRKIIEGLLSNPDTKVLLADAVNQLDETLRNKLQELLG